MFLVFQVVPGFAIFNFVNLWHIMDVESVIGWEGAYNRIKITSVGMFSSRSRICREFLRLGKDSFMTVDADALSFELNKKEPKAVEKYKLIK